MEHKKRRSSIIFMESEETKRNDEILSRLDDDDDDDDDISSTRDSVNMTQRNSPEDIYRSIPCGRLRNYLKREQELKEVNAKYYAMIAQIRAEREAEQRDTKVPEENMVEEIPISPEPESQRDSVIPGEIGEGMKRERFLDTLVQQNNLFNSRLSVSIGVKVDS